MTTTRLTEAEQAAVDERDRATITELKAAEVGLAGALRTMPNSVGSVFDPAVDVPLITNALEHVRLILADAEAVIEKRGPR